MFGAVFRAFLLALIILTAITKQEAVTEYTPWCRYRVQAHLIVIQPRPNPCQRHKRFFSARLYITLLLLLLSGDVEINPGPVQSVTDLSPSGSVTSLTANDVTNPSCTSCGMPILGLNLRSRTISNTHIQCGIIGCGSFIHQDCKEAQSCNLSVNRTCSNHTKRRDETSGTHPEPCHHQLACDDPTTAIGDEVNAKPEDPTEDSDSLNEVQPDYRHSASQPCSKRPNSYIHDSTPGPSFISANLSDVMEAVRFTELKIDKLADEIRQLKQMFHSALRDRPETRSYIPREPAGLPMDSCDSQQRPVDLGVYPRLVVPPALAPTQFPVTAPAPERPHAPAPVTAPATAPAPSNHQTVRTNERTTSKDTTGRSLLIVGDSNVRRLQTGSHHPNTVFHSVPGAMTQHIDRNLGQFISSTDRTTDLVLHVGTNDVVHMGSEIVAKNVFKLAQSAKKQRGLRRIFVCSVVPRTDRGSFIFSRCESVNNSLHALCLKSSDVHFMDLRERLDDCPFSGLGKDALHYNKAGSSEIMRFINSTVDHFLS